MLLVAAAWRRLRRCRGGGVTAWVVLWLAACFCVCGVSGCLGVCLVVRLTIVALRGWLWGGWVRSWLKEGGHDGGIALQGWKR